MNYIKAIMSKYIKKNNIISVLMCFALSIVITVVAVMLLPNYFVSDSPTPVTITATGEPGAANPDGFSQVFIKSIEINGLPFDLSSVVLDTEGWGHFGATIISYHSQPNTLELLLPPGIIEITFVKGSGEGIVLIESPSECTLDLYAENYTTLRHSIIIYSNKAIALGFVIVIAAVLLCRYLWNKVFIKLLLAFIRSLRSALSREDAFDKKVLWQYIHCAVVFFTVLFIVNIFGPIHISRNSNTILNTGLMTTILLASIGISLIFALLTLLLKNKYKYLEVVLIGLLLICFVNSTIIPFQATILDGRDLIAMDDDIVPVIRNIVFLIACIIAGCFFRKHLRYIAVPMLVICIIFTLYNPNHTGDSDSESTIIDVAPLKSREEILQSAITFSNNKNIVIFVIDSFQGTVAEKTLLENPEYMSVFDGFTLFTRAFSSFAYSNYSAAVILSGEEYSTDNISSTINLKHAANNSFLIELRDTGARADSLGFNNYNIVPTVDRIAPSFSNPRYWYGYALAASIARLTGYWPSNPFFGDERNMVTNLKYSSIDFHDLLLNDIMVSGEETKILLFWDYILHAPLTLNRNGDLQDPNISSDTKLIEETVYELNFLQRYFEMMKKNDVYDNSLIIIVGDHGHDNGGTITHISHFPDFEDGYKKNGNFVSVNRYNPVLFVKPPNSRGIPYFTYDPAWNGDIGSIVNYYADNFDNVSPLDVVKGIRSQKPIVNVQFTIPGLGVDALYSSENHQPVEVTSLYDISAAFAALSGATDN